MTCTTPTQFLHINNIGDSLLMSELETNMKSFLNWCFLGIGAWFNVQRPTINIYGGSFETLHRVSDPNYTDGQVWQSVRKDWVWETGIQYQNGTGIQPIQISGVYVNNTFYTTGHATYGHYYDYPLGRVVFNNAISITSTVKLDYSYRWVQVYIADEAPWWNELQYGSFRADDTQFSLVGSGEWALLASNRVQLPAIVVECVPRGGSRPFELGNHSLILEQDMLFHVIAETRHDRNQIVDILRCQAGRSIWLYNSEKIARSGVYSLDYRGMLVNNSVMYPKLVEDYRWELCRFVSFNTSEVQTLAPFLHRGTIRGHFELIIGGYK